MIRAIVYLLAITVAEVLTTFVFPIWGLLCHIAVFLAIVVHSAVDIRYPHRRLLLSLALVPLVRIISLSMPLVGIPQIWWYPIIYAPLLVASLAVMRILNLQASQVGLFLRRIPIQLAVMLTGIPLGVTEYFILKPQVMVTGFTWQEAWLPAVIFIVCTGFVEELIFRGVLQRSAVESFGDRGIVYVSLLFAVLHMGYLSWVDVIFVFLIAMFFGWVVKKTGSLAGVSLSHGIINVVLYIVMPFFF